MASKRRQQKEASKGGASRCVGEGARSGQEDGLARSEGASTLARSGAVRQLEGLVACFPACVPAFLPACQPAMLAYPPCLPACLSTCLRTYLS